MCEGCKKLKSENKELETLFLGFRNIAVDSYEVIEALDKKCKVKDYIYLIILGLNNIAIGGYLLFKNYLT